MEQRARRQNNKSQSEEQGGEGRNGRPVEGRMSAEARMEYGGATHLARATQNCDKDGFDEQKTEFGSDGGDTEAPLAGERNNNDIDGQKDGDSLKRDASRHKGVTG